MRLHVQDCEEDVGEAFDAYAKAGHAAGVAKRKAERLGMQLRWMRQEEGLLRRIAGAQEKRRLVFEKEKAEKLAAEKAAKAAAGGGAPEVAPPPPTPTEPLVQNDTSAGDGGCFGCFGGGKKKTIERASAGGTELAASGGGPAATIGERDVAVLPPRTAVPRHGQRGRLGSGTAGHHRAHWTASEGSRPPTVSIRYCV